VLEVPSLPHIAPLVHALCRKYHSPVFALTPGKQGGVSCILPPLPPCRDCMVRLGPSYNPCIYSSLHDSLAIQKVAPVESYSYIIFGRTGGIFPMPARRYDAALGAYRKAGYMEYSKKDRQSAFWSQSAALMYKVFAP